MSAKSPSSTVFLALSLSHNTSTRSSFSASCWGHAPLWRAISLKIHYPAFKSNVGLISLGDCKEGCPKIPPISPLGFLNISLTFPRSQSWLLFLSKSIKSYLNCFKMPAQAIRTLGKGLLRQAVDMCSRWLGFLWCSAGQIPDPHTPSTFNPKSTAAGSIKQRDPRVSSLSLETVMKSL